MRDILKHIGYSRSESAVYATLVELGPSPVGKIAQHAGISRVAVYDALERLLREGLASYSLHRQRKVFSAATPRKVEKLITERKRQLDADLRKMPMLWNSFSQMREHMETKVYHGMRGLQTFYEEFLEAAPLGGEWLVFGVPKRAELAGGFLNDLSYRRAAKKVKLKIVYNQDAKKLIEVRKRTPLSEVRVLPAEYLTPASIDILPDRVGIAIFGPDIAVFVLKGTEVAKSFQQYFRLVWKQAERV